MFGISLKNITKTTVFCFIIAILSIVISIGIKIIFAAWQPPSSTPPTGDISAPINVSSVDQTKAGGLTIGKESNDGVLKVYTAGDAYFVCTTCVGTSDLVDDSVTNAKIASNSVGSSELDETGCLENQIWKIIAGQWSCQGDEGVLGSGTQDYITKWSSASTLGDSNIYQSGDNIIFKQPGNVGIDKIDPDYKLDVNGQVNGSELCISGDCRNAWPGLSGTGTDNYIPRWKGTSALEDSVIIQDDVGRVGIGALPTAKLEVSSNSNYGIKSTGNSAGMANNGVYGEGSNTGIYGYSTAGYGVYGLSNSNMAIYGYTTAGGNYSGVWGVNKENAGYGYGVFGVSGPGVAVIVPPYHRGYGMRGCYNTGSYFNCGYLGGVSYAGYFQGDVLIERSGQSSLIFKDSGSNDAAWLLFDPGYNCLIATYDNGTETSSVSLVCGEPDAKTCSEVGGTCYNNNIFPECPSGSHREQRDGCATNQHCCVPGEYKQPDYK